MRVEGRDAGLVAAVAAVSGVLAALAGASPTGASLVDVVMVLVSVAACVWAAASAPWWAGVVASGVALAFAPSVGLIALGLLPFMGGLAVGSTKRSLPWSRALVAGAAIQVFIRIGDVVFFGFSAILGLAVLTALAVLGVRRRPRRERRRVIAVAGGVFGLMVLALVGFALAGSSARPDIENANSSAQEGLSFLRAGDFASAQASFARAAEQFRNADGDLGSMLAQPARLVPVAAQYRRVGASLVAEAADATEVISTQLGRIDYEHLRVVNGAIDVQAIESLAEPLAALDTALDGLATTVEDAKDPWLVSAARDRLDELTVDLAKAKVDLTNARAAVDTAPDMLGGDGKRVYFVAFTTPVEARGSGGFMGNWAEVTIDAGKLSVTGFGRTRDLTQGGLAQKKITTPSDEFVAQYGDFLFADRAARLAGPAVWSNVTVSPDFPTVAEMIAELYPQSGGEHLDGVFAADVYTVAELMKITGPVTLPDGTTLTGDTAAQYLLADQYLNPDNEGRIDALEAVASETITSLLTSSLPAPPELAERFGPLAHQHRLMGWSPVDAEEQLLQLVDMAGTLPDRGAGDSVGVAFNNGSASKIDFFMNGDIRYDVTIDANTGSISGVVTVTMRNEAPPTGLPDYVIGNVLGLPTGTNRTQVMLFTALPATSVTMNGQPIPYNVANEAGHNVTSAFVDVAPGATLTFEVKVVGSLAPGSEYQLTTRSPASANDFPVTVSVNGAEPVELLSGAGTAVSVFAAP
jgi:hypothetical protein